LASRECLVDQGLCCALGREVDRSSWVRWLLALELGAQRSGFCGITSGGWSGEQRARGETLKCLGELARCFERELRPYDWSGQFVVDLGHRPRVADAIDSELRVAREHSSSALRALAFGCSTPLDAAPLRARRTLRGLHGDHSFDLGLAGGYRRISFGLL
jgi:hypothetical protein